MEFTIYFEADFVSIVHLFNTDILQQCCFSGAFCIISAEKVNFFGSFDKVTQISILSCNILFCHPNNSTYPGYDYFINWWYYRTSVIASYIEVRSLVKFVFLEATFSENELPSFTAVRKLNGKGCENFPERKFLISDI